jgi:hypothetical protein
LTNDFPNRHEKYGERNYMIGKLAGKVALISGASAGIGRASAVALAQEGVNWYLPHVENNGWKNWKQPWEKLGAGPSASLVMLPRK